MSHHEKCDPQEVFLGNTERFPGLEKYAGCGFKTMRLGNVALDIEGRKLPAYYAPIFIHRSEEQAYDAYMMRQMSKR